ncbi:MAG: myxococcus cysteine-rich repeat containing protein [Deltaproteobacteria bacterium]
MRSLLLAIIAAVAIPACTQDITGGGGPGGGGGGDDQQQPTCGNGVVDPGETCDDGNTNNGDGCSSTCQTENTAAPRVGVTVDNPTLPAMDLGMSASVAVTLTSMMGYAGDVTLSVSAADSTDAAITDWVTNLDSTTATLASDGTATAHVAISAMGDAAMLAGKVKVTATFGAMTADASVDVTFNPVFRVTYTNSGTNCVYPTDGLLNNPYKVKVGRKLSIYNGGNGFGFVIHGDGQNGLQHETIGTPGTTPGNAYTSNALTDDGGGKHQFYCHGPVAGDLTEATGAQRNYFVAVP